MFFKHKIKNQGFTLVEVLVATFVFFLVIGAAVGLLVSSVQSQAVALAEQKVAAEISYVVEYMSRSLRMATRDATGDCLEFEDYNYLSLNEGQRIRFLSYNEQCQEFYFNDGRIYERKSSDNTSGNFQPALPMTSLNVVVDDFLFSNGESDWHLRDNPSEGNQPKVAISMKISPKGPGASMVLQTSVSQRLLNVPRVADLPITQGLALRLDASAITGLSDGDPVYQWDDLSGNNNHLTQGDSNRQPEYHNDKVLFDGNNDYLEVPAFLSSPFDSVSVFLVGDFAGSTNDGWGYGLIQSTGNVGSASFFSGITGTHGDNGSINITLDGNWSNGEIEIYPNKGDARIQTLIYGNSNYKAYVSGSEELDQSAASSVSISGTFNIGGHSNHNRSVDGSIFEVIVYDRALSDSERQQVELYLSNKWGINLSN